MKFSRIVDHLWVDVENERQFLSSPEKEDIRKIYNRIYEILDEMELYRLCPPKECANMREKLQQGDFKGFWELYEKYMKQYRNRRKDGERSD